ncbi:MAG: RNA methyltransferase, partial [Candidatus Bipolaricaulota bacterium]
MLYIALLHFPMLNRRGEVVATALTSMDVPDIARTARTYGAQRYFVATPLPSQRKIATVLRDFWLNEEPGSSRRQAMELVHICSDFGDCYEGIDRLYGRPPVVLGA